MSETLIRTILFMKMVSFEFEDHFGVGKRQKNFLVNKNFHDSVYSS